MKRLAIRANLVAGHPRRGLAGPPDGLPPRGGEGQGRGQEAVTTVTSSRTRHERSEKLWRPREDFPGERMNGGHAGDEAILF